MAKFPLPRIPLKKQVIAAIARILAGAVRAERSARYGVSDVIFGVTWLVFYIVVLAT